MVRTSFLFFFLSMGLASVAQTQIPASGFLDPQAAAQKANAREEEVYSSATDALNSGQYDNAIKGFTEAAKIHGRRADGALYWKAYALRKAGKASEAEAVLTELQAKHPGSRWLDDAKALALQIKQEAGRPVSPDPGGLHRRDVWLRRRTIGPSASPDRETVKVARRRWRRRPCPCSPPLKRR